LQLRYLDLRDIVRVTVDRMQPLVASATPIGLKLPERPVMSKVDPGRLETVIANLIDNAVKYSPQDPRVECELSVEGERAQISVKDNGIGIAREDISKLFKRFSRIATEETHAISGTGLGLYIAHQLIVRHGGDITVTSRPGAGSVFCVSLPLAAADPAMARKAG
jgi:signal transduction histidine kinase